jgi:hypothetical protein
LVNYGSKEERTVNQDNGATNISNVQQLITEVSNNGTRYAVTNVQTDDNGKVVLITVSNFCKPAVPLFFLLLQVCNIPIFQNSLGLKS